MKRLLLVILLIASLFSLVPKAWGQTQTVANGNPTTAVNFTGTGCVFNWTNDQPGIGLAASGTGNIASFTAVNSGSTSIVAHIAVTPTPVAFAYIPNTGSNNVSIINTTTNTVVGVIGVGSSPNGVAVSADGTKVYVSNYGSSSVSVINTATNTISATITVGSLPLGVAVSADGSRVYTANQGPSTVSVINTVSNSVIATVTLPGSSIPSGIAVSPDGTRVYTTDVSTNKVSVINASTNAFLTSINVGTVPWGVTVSPDGTKLYVVNQNSNSISVISTASNLISSTITVSAQPYGITVSPDGTKLYVTFQNSPATNTVDVINASTHALISTINVGLYGGGVSVSPDGSAVYAVNENSNSVSVISTATNTVTHTITVGSTPIALGNFISPGNCSSSASNFTITVDPTVPPAISVNSTSGKILACPGTASTSPLLKQVGVSAVGLTGNLTATAPANFEISLSATSGFGTTVTLIPSGGTVNNTVIYARSAASASGTISGNLSLSSPGATTVTDILFGVVALPTVNAVANQSLASGANTTAVNFTGTGNVFNWTNDSPGIGLAASGTGNIAAFTATNTGSTPVLATITVTPVFAPLAYITNVSDGTVSIINLINNKVIATVPTGFEAYGAAVSPDGGSVYISNEAVGSVSVINASTNTVTATIVTGGAPAAIAASPDGTRVYVADNANQKVLVINTATNAIIATVPVDPQPRGIAVSPDGSKVYVSNYGFSDVSVINTATNTVSATITVGGGPFGIAVSPDGSKAYVANNLSGTVSVVNTATNAILTTITVGNGPFGLSMSPDGSKVYVVNGSSNNVSVISTTSNTVVATIGVGSTPVGASVSADGSTVYVANSVSNSISVISTATNTVTSTITDSGGPYAYGNFITGGTGCNGTPITFTIQVTPNPPVVSASGSVTGVNTIYGTPSLTSTFNVSGVNMTAGILVTPPTGFEVSASSTTGFGPTVTIGAAGTIASTPVYIRLAATTAVGSYTGLITINSTGSNTISTPMIPSVVSPAALSVKADNVSKVYGSTLTGAAGSAAFTPTGLQNGETIGSVTIAYGTGSSATAAVGNYPGTVSSSGATGGTFSAGNYTITYPSGDIIVTPAALTITANTVNKIFGNTLTGGPGSSDFISAGLQNGETVGSVTITYGTGSAAADPIATYSGTAVPSTATGGTFTPGNYTITYVNGDIVVDAPPTPIIASTGILSALRTTYGTASATTTFNVSGTDMTAGILVTPPTGFEVSTSPSSGFATAITVGSAGTIASTPVYMRLAATTGVNIYSGNIVLTSAGATDVTFATLFNSVTPAPLTITANVVSKTFGNILTGGPGSTAFSSTGLKNLETIGTVTITYGAGSAATDPIATYTGSVVASLPTGGTFLAGNYTITYVNGDINVIAGAGPTIASTGSLTALSTTYGTASATTTFDVSGTNMTAGILVTAPNGFEVSSSPGGGFGPTINIVSAGTTIPSTPIYIRLAAATAVDTYSGNIGLTSPGAINGSIATVASTVTPAPLTITANTVSKTFGTTITGAAGSTAFIPTGLKNSENIGSVTIAYGTGSAAAAPVSTYTGSVTASAATGGTFTASNYTITYAPGDIIVTAAPIPAVAPTGSLSGLNTTYGTVSATTTFNVSGTNMTGGILVTPPAGFEVSASPASGFGTTVIIGAAGTIVSTPVYVRLAAITAVGTYSGNIILSSTGATSASIATVSSNVTPAALSVVATPVVKVFGSTLVGVPVSSAFVPVGLKNGESIGSVTIAYGLGASPLSSVATYTGSVTPSAATGGTFTASNYTITYVHGNLTVIAAPNQTIVNGSTQSAVSLVGSGCAFNWTNDTPSIGLPASGSGTVASFTAINTGTTPVIATINVIPSSVPPLTCSTTPFTFTVTVNPSPIIASSGSLSALSTTYGTASATTTFNVAGTFMTAGILVTPSAGFEVSTSPASGFGATVSIPFVAGGTIASTPVYLRLKATTPVGSYPGNIVLGTTGGVSVNVPTVSSSVTPAPLTITATTVSKVFGTTITGAAGSTAFTSVGLQNSETIGSVTVAYGIGSAAGAAVATYPGSVTGTAATGGTFTPGNYIITYSPGNIIVTAPPTPAIASTGSLSALSTTYGTASATTTFNVSGTNMTAGILVTPPVGFEVSASPASGFGLAVTIGAAGTIVSTPVYIRLAATTPVGTYSGNITLTSAGATTGNVTTVSSNVTPAPLTITANNVNKTFGTTITGSAGSTAFIPIGLKNAETIGSITVAYGAGSAAADVVTTYPGSVTASAAVGGTFTAGNYVITYVPGNIIVTAGPVATITATGSLAVLSTTYGTVSATTTFNVSGTNMIAGVLVTAPAGFEVSTSPASGFGAAVTIGVAGTIASTPVYVRLAITASVGTYSGNILLTSAGANTINVATVNSTVTPAALTITASNRTKVFGTLITNGAGFTSFTSSGLKNGETIGTVTITYGIGSAATATVATYTGSVTASLPVGGTFTAGNYTITYIPGDIIVTPTALATIATTGSTATLTTTYGTASGATTFNVSGVNMLAGILVSPPPGFEVSASPATGFGTTVTIGASGTIASTPVYLRVAATTAVGSYSGNIVLSSSTATNVNVPTVSSSVTPAPLTVTASNVNKPFGTAITGGTGSTAFTSIGLKNAEAIGSVTIAYGTGSAAAAAVATYPGSVTASAATGGTFSASNYAITYSPGNIIVTAGPTATITSTGSLSALGTTYGTASGTTTFNVSGTNMTAGILVTPPAGFEVSASPATGFGTTVTIGAVGTIASTPVYVRLAATTAVGTYSGNVTLTSAGATTRNIATVLSGVTPTPLTITANSVTKAFGVTITGSAGSAAFTSSGLKNGEIIGSVTIAYGTGSAAAATAATYTGSVTPSAATGGTFTTSNYTITYVHGDITVSAPIIPVITGTGTLPALGTVYGTASVTTGFTVSGTNMTAGILITAPPGYEVSTSPTSGFGSTVIIGTAGTIAPTIVYIRLASNAPAGNYAGNITLTSAGASPVSIATTNSTTTKAPLTITANNITKNFGTTLTGGPGTTGYTVTGLQNGETIGSLTLVYGAGSSSASPTGTYAGSVTPSLPTGGTFTASNYSISYINGDIIVTAPTITATGTLTALTTIYGATSANTSFSVSGANMTAGILVTAPAGFQVSASPASGFNGTITIGSAGTIAPTTIYIRLAATTAVGTYSGNVLLISTGAGTVPEPTSSSTVIPAALTITPANESRTYGKVLTGGAGSGFFTSSGLQNGEKIGSVTLAYGTGSLITDGAGTYTGSVQASAATGGTFNPANYTIVYNTGDLIVYPALLTITADDKSKGYGTANPTLTVTYTGFVNNDTQASLTILPAISTTAIAQSMPGQYPITANGASSPNYTFKYVQGVLTINPLPAIPNAFTPNGDGINDTWNIKYLETYPGNTVDVYNRFGVKVFSSIGYGTSWDGTYKGTYLPTGTYYYVINCKNGLGLLVGYVALIR